jgi:hypothetical protein
VLYKMDRKQACVLIVTAERGEHCDTSYVPDQNVDNYANAKITSVNDTSCYSLSHITL